jgi:hypothetical protein
LQHQLMVDFQTSCTSAMESLCSFSKSTSPNFSRFSLACCHQSRVCHGQLWWQLT